MVRALWTRTRIPFTREQAVAYGADVLGLRAGDLRPALEALIADGVVFADGDGPDATLLWPGEDRPTLGPRTVEEAVTLARLEREAALPVPVKIPAYIVARPREEPAQTDSKSVLASGALSLLFGPLGWLYAAPAREAIPAMAVFFAVTTLVSWLLPAWIAAAFSAVAFAGSGLIGMAYAHRFNQHGRRAPLLDARVSQEPPPRE
jgi:hypothetical protein